MEEEMKGNPMETNDKNVQDAVIGSSNDFFEQMEHQVNGAIIDDQPEQVTPAAVNSGTEMATHTEEQQGSNNAEAVDWEKRYKDSSREAIKMRDNLNNLKPFVPLLNAMKQDTGLVEHVRDYLKGGGTPAKSVKERLNLDEDFIYDQNEALEDPDSDSAKVFNAHVDGMVQNRVQGLLDVEKKKAAQVRNAIARKKEETDFRARHQMGDEDYKNLVMQAKNHRLSLDDIYYILNRDKVAGNVAKSTKDDMLNQMKSVRDVPTSASGVNSPDVERDPNDDIFDTIIGSDAGMDDLFG